ncbi:MAG TPA: hypothetical protein VG271_13540 [Beijerinckiaceae bacterium]|jgi:hypothetical protein|nr:hypothetical protein [Beijerinckiaceae bacterium]
MSDIASLPVAPASVIRLSADDAHDAGEFINYIVSDLTGALDACDSVRRLCPEFASAVDLLRRKIVTLHTEAVAMRAVAESGCAPII